MSEIYELCDCTDDERYFTLGVFSSLSEVLEVIAEADKRQDAVTESGTDGDVELIEIRKRPFGLTFDGGVKVYECTRTMDYNEDNDENFWETVKTWTKDGEQKTD